MDGPRPGLAKCRAMRLGCLGMATQDTLLFTGEASFEEESVTHVDAVVPSTGGKGLVAAIAMRYARADVMPFALVGRDSDLARSFTGRVDTSNLLPVLDQDNRTWITIAEGHRMITMVKLGKVVDKAGAIAQVGDFARSVDLLYITAEDPALIEVAFGVAAERRVPIALNPSLPMLKLLAGAAPDLLSKMVDSAVVVLCNDWEAPLLLKALGVGDWAELGGHAEVIVTSGGAGGRYASPPYSSWRTFEAKPVERVRCVVGAGDTFAGAYLKARFVDGEGISASCDRGAELAALKVAYKGSALPPAPPGLKG